MTRELKFVVKAEITDDGSVEETRQQMKKVLADLYDLDSVEKVVIGDKNEEFTGDMEKLVEDIDDLDSRDIQRAIDFVRELEEDNE